MNQMEGETGTTRSTGWSELGDLERWGAAGGAPLGELDGAPDGELKGAPDGQKALADVRLKRMRGTLESKVELHFDPIVLCPRVCDRKSVRGPRICTEKDKIEKSGARTTPPILNWSHSL